MADLTDLEVLVGKVADLEARVAALEAAAVAVPVYAIPLPCGRKAGGAPRN